MNPSTIQKVDWKRITLADVAKNFAIPLQFLYNLWIS